MTSGPEDLSSFNGVARLFPLPDFVLFPHVVAPLHIFEPRYRQMTTDALAGDKLLALVLLKPGHEEEYEGTPPIHDMACLAQIVNEQRLADGRFHLLVRGVCRVQLLGELPGVEPYRQARARPHPDANPTLLPALRRELADAAYPLLPQVDSVVKQMKELFESPMPIGGLCDILSFALPVDVAMRQELLSELDIAERARRLITELESGRVPALIPPPRELRRYPPDFSPN